jgi:hypothetical protein
VAAQDCSLATKSTRTGGARLGQSAVACSPRDTDMSQCVSESTRAPTPRVCEHGNPYAAARNILSLLPSRRRVREVSSQSQSTRLSSVTRAASLFGSISLLACSASCGQLVGGCGVIGHPFHVLQDSSSYSGSQATTAQYCSPPMKSWKLGN